MPRAKSIHHRDRKFLSLGQKKSITGIESFFFRGKKVYMEGFLSLQQKLSIQVIKSSFVMFFGLKTATYELERNKALRIEYVSEGIYATVLCPPYLLDCINNGFQTTS